MDMIMHSFVFVPAMVFGAVAVVCWGVGMVIDRREGIPAGGAAPAAVVLAAARPAQRGFRPVVIEGGRAMAAIGSFRVAQTPLGSAGAVVGTHRAARSYGG